MRKTLLHGGSSGPAEPSDTRANTVRRGGQHDALAEASLVEGLLLALAGVAGHYHDDPERRAGEVSRGSVGRRERAEGLPVADEHELHGWRFFALPDQRAAVSTSSTTAGGTGSARN